MLHICGTRMFCASVGHAPTANPPRHALAHTPAYAHAAQSELWTGGAFGVHDATGASLCAALRPMPYFKP